MIRKKPVSFSLSNIAERKIREISKKTGLPKSKIIEYAILQILPDPNNEKDLKSFASTIANWLIETQMKNNNNNTDKNNRIIIVNK
jgi:hypothetical protein